MKRSVRRIAHVTDLHLDEDLPRAHGVQSRYRWQRVLEDIADREVDQLICTGDIGEAESLPWFFDSLHASNLPFNIVLGNHDSFDDVYPYLDLIAPDGRTELYYSYEDDAFNYVFLDSSSGLLSDVQVEYLANTLRNDKTMFLFIHHPILDCGTVLDRDHGLQNRRQVRSLLSTCRQEIFVFCGHYHMTDERHSAHIHQYISPAVCFQMYAAVDPIEIHSHSYGYRMLEIDGTTIRTEIITMTA